MVAMWRVNPELHEELWPQLDPSLIERAETAGVAIEPVDGSRMARFIVDHEHGMRPAGEHTTAFCRLMAELKLELWTGSALVVRNGGPMVAYPGESVPFGEYTIIRWGHRLPIADTDQIEYDEPLEWTEYAMHVLPAMTRARAAFLVERDGVELLPWDHSHSGFQWESMCEEKPHKVVGHTQKMMVTLGRYIQAGIGSMIAACGDLTWVANAKRS